MKMEPGVGRHRLPSAGGAVGMRSMSLIGAIGIFAMLMALAGWGLLSLFGGSSGPNSTPPLGVTGVSFTCTSAGKGIQATLTFVSTTSVTATLRAGDTTTTKTGAGSISVTIVGTAGPSDCWAAIDGMAIGTIPAT